MTENKKLSGLRFLSLGLLTFFTLGMDLFVIPIDRLLWGNELGVSSFFSNP